MFKYVLSSLGMIIGEFDTLEEAVDVVKDRELKGTSIRKTRVREFEPKIIKSKQIKKENKKEAKDDGPTPWKPMKGIGITKGGDIILNNVKVREKLTVNKKVKKEVKLKKPLGRPKKV